MGYFPYLEGMGGFWDWFSQTGLSHELDFILLFLLIFAFLFAILSKRVFPKNRGVCAIIALSVSLMSTWFLSQEQFFAHIVTYNIFAIIITGGLAFLIFLYFIHKIPMPSGIRKAFILAFGVGLYIALQQYGGEDLSGLINIILVVTIILLLVFDNSLNDHINH